MVRERDRERERRDGERKMVRERETEGEGEMVREGDVPASTYELALCQPPQSGLL